MCSGVATLVANMQPTFTRAVYSAFGVVYREDFVGVAQPGFEKARFGGLAAQLRHRAHETEPVQQLLMPTGLHVGEWRLTPGFVIRVLQGAKVALVRINIRMEVRRPG